MSSERYGLRNDEEKFKVSGDFPGWPVPKERLIFYVPDFSHAIKKLVNSLESSGQGDSFHRCIQMRVDHPYIPGISAVQLMSLHQLHEVYKRAWEVRGPQIMRGLRTSDFVKTSFSRMRVGPFMRVMGPKMLGLLSMEREDHYRTRPNVLYPNEALYQFISRTAPVISIFNDPKKNLSGASEKDIEVLEGYADYLEHWRSSILDGSNGTITESSLSKHFVTDQCYEDLLTCVRGLVGCVRFYLRDSGPDGVHGYGRHRFLKPRMCSQDPLEHHFGNIRGYLRHMRLTAANVYRVAKSSEIVRALNPSKNSNVHGTGDYSEQVASQLYRPSLGFSGNQGGSSKTNKRQSDKGDIEAEKKRAHMWSRQWNYKKGKNSYQSSLLLSPSSSPSP